MLHSPNAAAIVNGGFSYRLLGRAMLLGDFVKQDSAGSSETLGARHRVALVSCDDLTLVPAGAHLGSSDCQESHPAGLDSGQAICFEGYEVLREIGRGGMGVVYLARQTSLDRLVAIKTFISQDLEDTRGDLLKNEARLVSRLDHPAIVPVYAVNIDASPAYFSMAYVSGENLAASISRQVLGAKATARLGVRIADALNHAHRANVLHLDIKPANVLLDSQGDPKLTDFGLAALLDASEGCDGIVGTPQFMSPEQALGKNQELTVASDIYSLGAVLYACLVGRPPIVASDKGDLILRIVSQPPVPLARFGLRVPRPLEAIVLKCLEKDPRQRYSSAEELRDDLNRFLSGDPVKARAPGVWAMLGYYLRRHVLATSVSGSVVLLLLAMVGWMTIQFIAQNRELIALRESTNQASQALAIYERLIDSAVARNTTPANSTVTGFDAYCDIAHQLYAAGDGLRAARYAALSLQVDGNRGAKDAIIGEIIESFADETGLKDWKSMPLEELADTILTLTNSES